MSILRSLIKKNSFKEAANKKAKSKNVTYKNNYKQGGCMGRDLRAIYIPPNRGKLKGYMR